MAKGAGEQISKAGGISDQQVRIGNEADARAKADYERFQSNMRPAVSKYSALATGNRTEALEAAMPVISQIASGFNGARQQIFNSMPPGAARDRALADLEVQKATGTAGAQAEAVRTAPDMLAQLASLFSGSSSTQLGASLAGLQGGAATNEAAMRAKIEQQKAWLNFFGQIGSAVGGMVAGGMGGGKPAPASTGSVSTSGYATSPGWYPGWGGY